MCCLGSGDALLVLRHAALTELPGSRQGASTKCSRQNADEKTEHSEHSATPPRILSPRAPPLLLQPPRSVSASALRLRAPPQPPPPPRRSAFSAQGERALQGGRPRGHGRSPVNGPTSPMRSLRSLVTVSPSIQSDQNSSGTLRTSEPRITRFYHFWHLLHPVTSADILKFSDYSLFPYFLNPILLLFITSVDTPFR